MDAIEKKIPQISDAEQPIYEAYTVVKSQDSYLVRTIVMRGDKAIGMYDSPPYWHVEAVNKFKIAAGKMFEMVKHDKPEKF